MKHILKILIIEDFKAFNDQLKIYLEETGHEVFQAYTLQEANAILQDHVFDYILLDLMLPDGEGEEIVYQIRYGLAAKIIVLTGDEDLQRREMLFTHGILDYISKLNPYDYIINELSGILQTIHHNHNRTILVVDDSGFIRKHIVALLEIREYHVLSAEHGEKALEILQNSEQKIDLIILDLEMPGINGEKVLRYIRKNNELAETPVLVLSGTQNKELVSRVLKHGANDFMKKPFSIEELVLKSKMLIEYFESKAKLAELNTHMQEQIEKEVVRFQEQERMMLQQSRLAAMGEMIGNIAHQWRQPLNALSLTIHKLNLAQEYNKLTPEYLRETVDKADSLIERMSQTIDDFRNFFKPEKEKQAFLMEDAIRNVMQIMESSFENQNIQVESKFSHTTPMVGYASEFQQVLLALLSNARDAIMAKHQESGGMIRICGCETEKEIRLCIQDNGGGIPETVLPHVFEPYFTTKSASGTGIGLYMSKRIIEGNMGGSLTVQNENDGALFKITFPQAS